MNELLFLDSDDGELDGLKKKSFGWQIKINSSIEHARECLTTDHSVKVIVVSADLHGVDGVNFLAHVKETYPDIIRFIALAETDSKLFMSASAVSHQCLSKPYDEHEIKVLMLRALSLRQRLDGCTLRDRLHDIGGLPSLPTLYKKITDEMYSSDPSLAKVSEFIEKDLSLSAKVLQVVNSAGIGLGSQVTLVSQAVTLLGMERLSTMVLLAEVYSMVGDAKLPPGFSLEALWQHSLQVSNFSKVIADEAVGDRQLTDASFTAGLLHDIGMVILAAHFATELGSVLVLAKEDEISLWEAEKEIFGTTHAEIGGYLLELWGLPDPIVEAVTFHDLPSSVPEEAYPNMVPEHGFTPLAAVHIANYFCEDERRAAYGCVEGELDSFFTERLGFTEKMNGWMEACLDSAY